MRHGWRALLWLVVLARTAAATDILVEYDLVVDGEPTGSLLVRVDSDLGTKRWDRDEFFTRIGARLAPERKALMRDMPSMLTPEVLARHGFLIRFDDELFVMQVRTPPAWRRPRMIALMPARRKAPLWQPTGLLVSFGLEGNRQDRRLDARIWAGAGTWLVGAEPSWQRRTGWRRPVPVYLRWERENGFVQLGRGSFAPPDAPAGALVDGISLAWGWARHAAERAFLLPDQRLVLDRPADVEIWINDALQWRQRLKAGVYDLRRLPVWGVADVRLRIRYDDGVVEQRTSRWVVESLPVAPGRWGIGGAAGRDPFTHKPRWAVELARGWEGGMGGAWSVADGRWQAHGLAAAWRALGSAWRLSLGRASSGITVFRVLWQTRLGGWGVQAQADRWRANTATTRLDLWRAWDGWSLRLAAGTGGQGRTWLAEASRMLAGGWRIGVRAMRGEALAFVQWNGEAVSWQAEAGSRSQGMVLAAGGTSDDGEWRFGISGSWQRQQRQRATGSAEVQVQGAHAGRLRIRQESRRPSWRYEGALAVADGHWAWGVPPAEGWALVAVDASLSARVLRNHAAAGDLGQGSLLLDVPAYLPAEVTVDESDLPAGMRLHPGTRTVAPAWGRGGALVWRLERKVAVHARLLDPAGRPVAWRRVFLYPEAGGEGSVLVGYTDGKGWLFVEGVAPGAYLIAVEGEAGWDGALHVPARNGLVRLGAIRMRRSAP